MCALACDGRRCVHWSRIQQHPPPPSRALSQELLPEQKQTLNVEYENYQQISKKKRDPARHNVQYARAADCYRAALRSAADRGRNFTHIIRTRPDSIWYANMPRISTLAPVAVSLRARSVFANITLHEDAASWWNVCNNRAICNALTPKDMRCLEPDDQFAVVPVILAPTYFLAETPSAEATAARLAAESAGLQPSNTDHIIYKHRLTIRSCPATKGESHVWKAVPAC